MKNISTPSLATLRTSHSAFRSFSAMRKVFVPVLALAMAGTARAASGTWDSDTSTSGIQDGSGTWTATSGNFWNTSNSADFAPVAGDTLTIGNTTGGFTITLNSGHDLYYGTSNLTFNQSYTLTAATAADGLGFSGNTVTVAGGKTVTINAYLNPGSTSTSTFALGASSTLNLSAGGGLGAVNATGVAGALNVGAGSYAARNWLLNNSTAAAVLAVNLNSGAAIRDEGATSVGSFGSGVMTGTTTLNVNSGAVYNATGGISIGKGSATALSNGSATVTIAAGGEVNANGAVLVGNGTTAAGNGGNAALTVNGGTFTDGGATLTVGSIQNTNNVVTDVLNINGGLVLVKGLALGGSGTAYTAGSTATVNLAGGTLYLGTTGLTATSGTNLTNAFNFSSGIFAAAGTSTSTVPIALSGTGGTFQTAAADGTSTNLTLNGVISGAPTGGLIKTGIGTLTLGAANTYSNGTTVKAGTLNIASGGSIGGALVMGGGTLTLNNTTQSFSGTTINAGGSAISVATGDTLALGAVTRSTGGTVGFTTTGTGAISTTTINSNGILGPWATIGSGASTRYVTGSASGSATNIAAFTGTAAATNANLTDGTGTVNYELTSASGTTQASVSANTIRNVASGTTTVGATLFQVNGLLNAGSGGWTIGSGTLTIGANKDLVLLTNTQALNINSVIKDNSGGASALTVSSQGGVVTLAGASTYSGGTFLDAGTVSVTATETAGTSGAFGASGNIRFGGGALKYSATNTADYSSRIKNSAGIVNIDLNGQTVTYASALDSSNTGGASFSSSAANGKMTLSAANAYTGLNTIGANTTVTFTGSGNLGATTNALNLSSATSTLDLAGTNQTVGSFYGGASGATVTNSSGTGSILTVGSGNNGVSETYAGNLTGNLGLTKVGGGSTLILTGATLTNTGATTVNGGVLQYNTAGSFGVTSAVTVNDGGAIVLNVSGAATSTSTQNLSIGGNGNALQVDAINAAIGTNTIAGNISLNDHASIGVGSTGTLTLGTSSAATIVNNGYTLTLDSTNASGISVASSISGAGGITKIGTSSTSFVTLSGNNTYTGNTTVLSGGGGSGSGAFRAGSTTAFGVNSALVIVAPTAANTLSGVDLNGFNNSFGSLTGGSATTAGSITLGGAVLTTGGDNSTTTFAGAIINPGTGINAVNTGLATNGGGLTKVGTGTQTITGANSFGATTINGGTLATSAGISASTTTTASYSTGATSITVASVSNLVIGQVITGTGISALITSIDTTNKIVYLSVATTAGASSGASVTGATWQSLGTGSLSLANTAGAGLNISAGALAVSPSVGSISGGGASGGNIALGANTLTTGSNNASTSYGGVVSGTGGLTKTGTGTQTLTGAHTYSGATTINGGALNVTTLANGGVASGIGQSTNAAANLVLNGGTLQYTGTTIASTDRNYTLGTSGGGFDASGTTAGALTISGNMTASGSSGNQTLTLSGTGTGTAGSGTISGVISNGTGTNVTALTKTGTGTWILSGANTFTGPTQINAGILDYKVGTAFGTNSAITVASGATAQVEDGVAGGGTTLTISGTGAAGANGALDFAGSASPTGGSYSGPIVLAADATISSDTSGDLFTLSGGITGNHNLTFVGAGATKISGASGIATGADSVTVKTGTVTLTGASGANTYSGGTVVSNGGTVVVGANDTLLTTGAVTLGESAGNTSGTLQLGTLASAANQTVASLTTVGTGIANAVVGGNSSVSTLTINNSAADAFSGTIGGSGSNQNKLALVKSGAGALTVTGTNTYSGGTTVASGTLYVNNSPAAGSGTGSGSVLVQNTGTLAGSGKVSGAVTVQSGGTLASGAAQTNVIAPTNPSGVDTVTGTGLTLTSNLAVNGGAGLTFDLGAGASTGFLNYASPNLNSTYITAGGTVAFGTTGGTVNIALVDLTAFAATDTLQLRYQNPYLLISAGGLNSNFNLVTTGGYDQNGLVLGIGSAGSGNTILNTFTFSGYDINGNTLTAPYNNLQLYLFNGQLEVVPEPGTWALMVGGLALLIMIQRRRRGSN